jgi:hypothetical protein
MYACSGKATQNACGNGANVFPARSCASAEDCEIKFLGACRDISGAKAHVCGASSQDSYSKCHTAAMGPFGLWPAGQTYNEVITVYMAPTDFNAFYTTCSPLATQ